MKSIIKEQMERFVHERKLYKRWLAVLLCLAIVVTTGTFAMLERNGFATDTSREEDAPRPSRPEVDPDEAYVELQYTGEASAVIELDNGITVTVEPAGGPDAENLIPEGYTLRAEIVSEENEDYESYIEGIGDFISSPNAIQCFSIYWEKRALSGNDGERFLETEAADALRAEIAAYCASLTNPEEAQEEEAATDAAEDEDEAESEAKDEAGNETGEEDGSTDAENKEDNAAGGSPDAVEEDGSNEGGAGKDSATGINGDAGGSGAESGNGTNESGSGKDGGADNGSGGSDGSTDDSGSGSGSSTDGGSGKDGGSTNDGSPTADAGSGASGITKKIERMDDGSTVITVTVVPEAVCGENEADTETLGSPSGTAGSSGTGSQPDTEKSSYNETGAAGDAENQTGTTAGSTENQAGTTAGSTENQTGAAGSTENQSGTTESTENQTDAAGNQDTQPETTGTGAESGSSLSGDTDNQEIQTEETDAESVSEQSEKTEPLKLDPSEEQAELEAELEAAIEGQKQALLSDYNDMPDWMELSDGTKVTITWPAGSYLSGGVEESGAEAEDGDDDEETLTTTAVTVVGQNAETDGEPEKQAVSEKELDDDGNVTSVTFTVRNAAEVTADAEKGEEPEEAAGTGEANKTEGTMDAEGTEEIEAEEYVVPDGAVYGGREITPVTITVNDVVRRTGTDVTANDINYSEDTGATDSDATEKDVAIRATYYAVFAETVNYSEATVIYTHTYNTSGEGEYGEEETSWTGKVTFTVTGDDVKKKSGDQTATYQLCVEPIFEPVVTVDEDGKVVVEEVVNSGEEEGNADNTTKTAYDNQIANYLGDTNDIQYYKIYWGKVVGTDGDGNNKEDGTVNVEYAESLSAGTVVEVEWDQAPENGSSLNQTFLYGTDEKGMVPRVLSLSALSAMDSEASESKSSDSKDSDSGEDRVEQEITALTKISAYTGYSSVTFTVGSKSERQGGETEIAAYGAADDNVGTDFAIISDRVFTGYVSNFSVTVTSDGTESFNTEVSGNDPVESDNGYDTKSKNGVVRSFDSVAYDLGVTTAPRSDTYTAKEANICFEMTMDMGLTEAEFDLSRMSWANTDGASWLIEYLDEAGDVVAYKDKTCGDGELYLMIDEGGNSLSTSTKKTINAIANGSTETAENKKDYYKDNYNITTQRIIGNYVMADDSGKNAVPGTQTLTAGIKVLNAANGTMVEPTFKIWLEGNEDNYGYNSKTEKDTNNVATPQDTNNVSLIDEYDADNNNTAYAVKVSAGAFYNMEIGQSNYLWYASWFDFTQGNEVSTVTSYTVGNTTVSGEDVVELLEALANLHQNWGKSNPAEFTDDSDKYSTETPADVQPVYPSGTTLENYTGEDGIFKNIRYGRMYSYGIALQMANLQSNGDYDMKGLSLPTGDITFNLQIGTSTSPENNQYYSILWDSYENVASNSGKQQRNLRWNDSDNTRYARHTVPFNKVSSGSVLDSCYNGGTWALTSGDTSAATTESTMYSFTVSGYDFDLEDYTFPVGTSTGGSTPQERYQKSEYNFSTGQVQVLSVYPRVHKEVVNQKTTLTVGNLSVGNISGQTIGPETGATGIDYSYEINRAGGDNTYGTTVTFYIPGSLTKANSFIKRDGYHVDDGYLGKTGTDDNFWTCNWDATAFVGDRFSIIGYGYLSANSEARIKAFNYLQLFDSNALYIDESKTENSDYSTGYYPSYTCPNQVTVLLRQNSAKTTKYDKSTILYAADPDYPEGYNTNGVEGEYTSSEMQEYMNGVREEDLVYATEAYNKTDEYGKVIGTYIWYDFDKDNNKDEEEELACIGVLAEVRGVENLMTDIDNGRIAVRIPVALKDDASIVGTTVSTVNTVRIWATDDAAKAMNDVSWANGVWDGEKNSVNGYQGIEALAYDGTGNGFQVANAGGTSGYTKVEYEDGQKVGGHTGGYIAGNSLLILGYKSGIKIDSEKDSGEKTYDTSKESEVNYTLSSINTSLATVTATSSSATTNLTIGVELSGTDSSGKALSESALDVILLGDFQMEVPAYEKNDDGTYIPVYEKNEDGTDKTDESGNKVQATETVTISRNEDSPTTVIVEYNGTCYIVSLYAAINEGNKTATITVGGAPVGANLPDITFQASLGTNLPNNSNVTATATIGGSGDQRAYEIVNGNMSTDTIYISQLASTTLSKSVDVSMMELDRAVTYTLTYANTSESAITTAYLYDILPYNGDIRSTDYTLTEENKEKGFNGTYLTGISAGVVKSGGSSGTAAGTTIQFYYSTEDAAELKGEVEGFCGYDEGKVKGMLGIETDEANVEGEETEEGEGSEEVAAESEPSGTEIEGDELETDEETGNAGTVEALFHKLGKLTINADGNARNGGTELKLDNDLLTAYDTNGNGIINEEDGQYEAFREEVEAKITCVYAVVSNIGANESLNIYLTMETEDNAGADLYGNVAWVWKPGTGNLRSSIVNTRVVSRSISGVVWYDANLNGIRDDNERLLSGVTCTLFKWDEKQEAYVVCTTDVTGAVIGELTKSTYKSSDNITKGGYEGSMVTDEDGAYSFEKLAPGNYVVAFSLSKKDRKTYDGATIYEVNGGNVDNTNDAVALSSTETTLDTENVRFVGIPAIGGETTDETPITYDYAIAYTLKSNEEPGNMLMNTLEDFNSSGAASLINYKDYQQNYANQDLGLVTLIPGPPSTGGRGIYILIVGGILLMAGSGLVLYKMRKKKEM